jgi:hypothetical protein
MSTDNALAERLTPPMRQNECQILCLKSLKSLGKSIEGVVFCGLLNFSLYSSQASLLFEHFVLRTDVAPRFAQFTGVLAGHNVLAATLTIGVLALFSRRS